jgi:hypothetical protein
MQANCGLVTETVRKSGQSLKIASFLLDFRLAAERMCADARQCVAHPCHSVDLHDYGFTNMEEIAQ